MQYHLSSGDYTIWVVTTLLEIAVCFLAFRRGLYRRLPCFTAYLFLVVAYDLIWWFLYHWFDPRSPLAYDFSWTGQGIHMLARGLAIAELCAQGLKAYRGIWALTWRLLAALALLLLSFAAADAIGQTYWIATFTITAERGWELAAIVILISLLLVSRYYGIRLEPLHKMIAVGLCLYSAVQVMNDTVLQQAFLKYFLWWGRMQPLAESSYHWWNEVRATSYMVPLLIWFAALWRPLPVAVPAPALLPQGAYETLSPQLNYRLRALNDRLLEMLKS